MPCLDRRSRLLDAYVKLTAAASPDSVDLLSPSSVIGKAVQAALRVTIIDTDTEVAEDKNWVVTHNTGIPL